MVELTRRALLAVPAGLVVAAALPAGAHGDPLGILLAEEHAAVYLYGLLTPRLPPGLRAAAQAAYDDHRRHRDTLEKLVREQRRTPAPARPAYDLPIPLDAPGGALKLANTIEQSLAAHYYEGIGEVPPNQRETLTAAFVEEAVHVTRWRYADTGDAAKSSVAFPGRPT